MSYKSHVIIVGGGIIGICTAYYLHKLGVEVTVIEKNSVGEGSSHKNAGWVCPSHVVPLAAPGVVSKGLKWMFNPESPFYIAPSFDAERAKWLWQFRSFANEKHLKYSMPILYELGSRSLGLYEELNRTLNNSFQFAQKGLLYVAMTDKGFEEIQEEGELIRSSGQRIRVMSPEEVCYKEPTIVEENKGGVLFYGDAHMNPIMFVRALSEYLKKNGVEIITKAEVVGFHNVSGHIRSVEIRRTHTDGSHSQSMLVADEFVMATGAWSNEMADQLGVSFPMQAAKGYSLTMPQGDTPTQMPILLSETKVAVTPIGDQIRYAGTLEIAGTGLAINQRRIEAIKKAAKRYLKNFDQAKADAAIPWAGLRPCTPDGLPIMGRSKQINNLTIATGHAMVGVAFATASGKLVAEIVQNTRPSIPIEPFRVDRF